MKRVSSHNILYSGIALIATLYLGVGIAMNRDHLLTLSQSLTSYKAASLFISSVPTPTPEPTLIISPSPTISLVARKKTIKPQDSSPWGVAEKVDDVTYTIKVGNDAVMTTPQELFNSLNNYRSINGKQSLNWDNTLATYAQQRAEHFKSIGSTDKHSGFNAYLDSGDGFQQLGYRRLGENSYYGGPLNGVHLIEWVFAQSPGHNANQLDSQWTHVGIGVTDTSANLIFGGEGM
ncbi:hypothetical protein A3I56_01925 [Candidatus Roizmanbacteria bacterium RIFCSPLOWO2_02_FULL_43_10]|uniref:SCP domain-containing protein n=3 Tax=Candidatus Roizmaniibacteriota TaxID=1752723 RepID=A0A1F7JUZ0_9BACT|nr:MAG: hypothetical protein A3D08_02370 [Candidatus Roizmanbacteria bacterium RIFCSPHIGHO2_02_FULL_43_11]OGK38389.1 MAG: hypothetical protein A3F32_00220 [Candidatus Roizmanbacteria bacterium RIFCSPHIGHO2_12_FULL_42_10]OGK59412.1 MAG: hypothetical protein A3I56_01925 [Candidatus Roizmanbacteria bacterium RIFCSPLOWO2_02_FULL_43_10]